MMITEVFPIKVAPSFDASSDTVFARLREASTKGGAKRQSYGMSIEDPNEFWWLIRKYTRSPPVHLLRPQYSHDRPENSYISPSDFENGFKPDDLAWDYATYGDPKDLFGQLTSEAPANSFVHLEGSETFPTGILDATVTEIVSIPPSYFLSIKLFAILVQI